MKRIILTIVTMMNVLFIYAQPWRNLVFEGGGIRGIAYAGAVEVLENEHITDSIEQVAGTSVGAIVASLLAVDFRAAEVKNILYDLKIQKFNDGRFIFFGGTNRFIKRYGWYRGNELEHLVGELLKQKTGNEHLTFMQLHQLHLKDKRFKDLYVTATNLSKQNLTVFSWQTYPDMNIKTAVRASFSIPLYFSALLLDEKGGKVADKNCAHEVFADGDILANYPLTIFDSNSKLNHYTLGVKLERPEQLKVGAPGIAPYNIVNFRTYIGALYNVILETLNQESYAYETPRTV